MDVGFSKSGSDLQPVKRAQIIQRVLVDGWSPAQAAVAFGLPERRIARWVQAYRQRGMASLRKDEPDERVAQRCLRSLIGAFSRGYTGLRRGFGLVEPAPCIPLRYAEEKSDQGRADLA